MILTKKFTCDFCKKTYTSDPDWSEEDRKEEARDNGVNEEDLTPEKRAVVCDDCYPVILEKWNSFKGAN